MGSIYRKLKGGRDLGWYAAFVDTDGKRRHVATKQQTKQAAKVFLAEIEARVRRGMVGFPEPDRGAAMSVRQLAERWLEARSGPKADKRRSTARMCLQRALPQLGDLPVSKLTSAHVEKLVAELGRRYAANSVRATIETLGSVLGVAVREGLVTTNAARRVHLPRRESAVEWLDAQEAARLLDLAEQRGARELRDGSRYVALSLALLCGLRRGEIFGLRWSDVDLDGRRLRIARSYDTTPKSGLQRHLPLPLELQPVLRAWRDRCPPSASSLVCPVSYRGRWGMASASGDLGLTELLAAAGCKRLRRGWHALRHTFASLFMQSGGDLFALSKLLGHADVRETQVYAHLSPDYLAAARERFRIRN
jgi:integrase